MKKDYMDTEFYCKSESRKIVIRATRSGAIVCKYPWQKCPTKKKYGEDPERCVMSKVIKSLPDEKEQRKKALEGVIKFFLLRRALKKRKRVK